MSRAQRRSSEISNAATAFQRFVDDPDLQEQLEVLLGHVVKEYVLSWYFQISTYPVFPRAISEMLSQTVLSIKNNCKQVNLVQIVLSDGLGLLRHHMQVFYMAREHSTFYSSHSIDSYFHSIEAHPALDNEAGYIRACAKRLVQNTLKEQDRDSIPVYLLSVDISSYLIETFVEALGRPDVLYGLLQQLLDKETVQPIELPAMTLVDLIKQLYKPDSPEHIGNLTSLCAMVFELEQTNKLNNASAWTYKLFETVIGPILYGLVGKHLDSMLVHLAEQLFEPTTLTTLLVYLDEFVFSKEAPEPYTMHETVEFIPYGQQRRQLSTSLVAQIPAYLHHWMGGKDHLEHLIDKNLLAVFASKQRNKHLLYGFIDIVMQHMFAPRPRRSNSIKYTNSHLRMPELSKHRTSYSTSASYKHELLAKSPS